MRKNTILVIFITLFLTTAAWATYSLAAKVFSNLGRHADVVKQTASNVTTKADVFAAYQVASYRGFCLWIYNSGTANLTDLDVLFGDENAHWDKAPINEVDAQPLLTDTNASCIATLNAATKCAICLEDNPGIGWVEVQASAATTAEVSVTLIGYHE